MLTLCIIIFILFVFLLLNLLVADGATTCRSLSEIKASEAEDLDEAYAAVSEWLSNGKQEPESHV